MAVDRPQDSGCWPETSVSWPHGPLHGAAHHMAPCLLQNKVSERAPKRSQSFYNLILGVISHYFCHILFLRNQSLNPAYILGEEITEGLAYQEVGWIIVGSLRGYPPRYPLKFKLFVVVAEFFLGRKRWGEIQNIR